MSRTFEPGRYKAKMEMVNLGKSKEKGTPEIRFHFTPLGRKIAGQEEPEPCPEYVRTIFRYLTKETVDYVIAELQQLGYDRESFAELDNEHPNAFPFAGIEFETNLKYETYKGEEKERWEFARGGIGKGASLEEKELRGLDAEFGAYLKKGGGEPNGSAKKPASKPAADQAEDPIPF